MCSNWMSLIYGTFLLHFSPCVKNNSYLVFLPLAFCSTVFFYFIYCVIWTCVSKGNKKYQPDSLSCNWKWICFRHIFRFIKGFRKHRSFCLWSHDSMASMDWPKSNSLVLLITNNLCILNGWTSPPLTSRSFWLFLTTRMFCSDVHKNPENLIKLACLVWERLLNYHFSRIPQQRAQKFPGRLLTHILCMSQDI